MKLYKERNGRRLPDDMRLYFHNAYEQVSGNLKLYIDDVKNITSPLFESSNYGAEQRYIFFYALHKAGFSSWRIKKWFGLDHTTVLYGINKLKDTRKYYSELNAKMQKIENIYSQIYGSN